MTDYGTIKLPRDDYEKHNKRRKELGITWLEYINGEAPDLPNGSEVNTTEVVEQLKNELSMANEPGVEIDIDRLYNRIDDLESNLPRKVAEELQHG